MMAGRKWKPVVVLWEDAETNCEPVSSTEFVENYKPLMRRTIGFLLHRDKDRIFVAMDNDAPRASENGNDCQTVTVIPGAMIHEVKYLQ